MRTNLTPEQLQRLVAFAEDDRQKPPVEDIVALNALHEAVQRNAIRHLEGAMKRNLRLNETLTKYKDREQARIDTGEFPGTGLTSVEVAEALLYQFQKNSAQKLSVGKIVLVLYRMYATWLYGSRERLFGEYPTANSYGAQFNDVYAHFKDKDLYERVPYGKWKALCEKNYSVAGFIERYAAKYGPVPYADIQKPILESRPYKNASRENNNGKWGKIIEDADIYAWKKAAKAKETSKTQ